jgi:hypothetical protein
MTENVQDALAMSESAEEKAFFEADRAAEPEIVREIDRDAGGRFAPKPDAAPTESAEQPETPDTTTETQPEAERAPRNVPLAALQAERQARQESEARARQLEERFQQVLERLAPPPAMADQTPALPDPDVDPIGHFKAVAEQVQAKLAQQEAQTAQQQQFAAFASAITRAETEFRAQAKDYDNALSFAKQSRDAELTALGFNDPAFRAQVIQNEVIQSAQHNLAIGRNPALAIYEYAKVRGYAATPPAQTGQDKIATIAAGQKASKSPSSAPGAVNNQRMTLEALASMSDDDFDVNFEKIWKQT